jgi:hypothetical protein
MAFTDYNEYLSSLSLNNGADFQLSAFATTSVNRLNDASRLLLPAPTVPTASVALDKSSNRAINTNVANAGSGRLSILGARINPSAIGGIFMIIIDALNISGGLNATVTTAQTTNLPTAALTRYTSGEGVHAGIVIHTALGGTATTATISYTNQAGTSGQTSPSFVFGGSGNQGIGQILRIPLAAGDTGVQSVESITLAATTGAAGNFGIILYKPLAMMFQNDIEGATIIDCVSSGRMVGQCNEVLDDACLTFIHGANTAQAVCGTIFLGEA